MTISDRISREELVQMYEFVVSQLVNNKNDLNWYKNSAEFYEKKWRDELEIVDELKATNERYKRELRAALASLSASSKIKNEDEITVENFPTFVKKGTFDNCVVWGFENNEQAEKAFDLFMDKLLKDK